jgi:2-oxoglutarate dehydrogenase E2 component (dihydrolipoamide succinyltransferase)
VQVRAPSPADDAGREERVKMTRLRQTIARRLKDAQNTAAMLTTFNEVDMTAVMALRSPVQGRVREEARRQARLHGLLHQGLRAGAEGIPAVNAEIDGSDLIYKNYYHVGVAVGTDKGLVVPSCATADQLSIAGIEKAIGLGKRARDGQLKIDDMQGGTFTITNGGIYGSLMSTPILNAPQSGILGMHKIQERPVVVGGKIEIRPMMYLALSYDHRVVDGKEAVTFLVRVKESLEDPERLVLDLSLRSIGMVMFHCPDGDATGADLEACTIWQGMVYGMSAKGEMANLQPEAGEAADKVVLPGIGPAIRGSSIWGEGKASVAPWDVLDFKGCGT